MTAETWTPRIRRLLLWTTFLGAAACSVSATTSSSTRAENRPNPCSGQAPVTCGRQADKLMQAGDARGADLAEAACYQGYAPSCANAAVFLKSRDPERAYQVQDYGCSTLRDTFGCVNLGVLLGDGVGTIPDYDRSLAIFSSACAAKDRRGCRFLGNSYRDKRYGPPNPAKAGGAYADGCKAGDRMSCLLVVKSFNEAGTPLLPQDENAWLQASCGEDYADGCYEWGNYQLRMGRALPDGFAKGCQWRDAASCVELGLAYQRSGNAEAAYANLKAGCELSTKLCYWFGLAASKRGQEATALQTWEAACSRDDARSCRALGVAYLRGQGVAMDGPRSQQLFRRACDLGLALGCATIGSQLMKGLLVPADKVAARAAFEEACGKGACTFLAAAEYEGALGKPNRARARELFDNACAANEPGACLAAATMARDGEGGPKDPGRAASLYSKACTAGEQRACNALAYILIEGKGVEADSARAFSLWETACKTVPEACDSIGEAYEKSLGGTPKNLIVAYERYMQACTRGVEASCTNATRVAKAVKKPAPVLPPKPKQAATAPARSAGGFGLPDLTGIVDSF